MDRSDNGTLSCIGPMSCHVMVAAEKQMKGVASWGRSGTFINTLRHTLTVGGEKYLQPAYHRQSDV
jgi:hypothetical protein